VGNCAEYLKTIVPSLPRGIAKFPRFRAMVSDHFYQFYFEHWIDGHRSKAPGATVIAQFSRETELWSLHPNRSAHPKPFQMNFPNPERM
jgi:hypothetical protein